MKLSKYLLILVLSFISVFSFSQNSNTNNAKNDSIHFLLSFRVNFDTKPKTKPVFEAYKNYLYSLSNGFRNSPYWSQKHIDGNPDYDLSATAIYGFRQGMSIQYIMKNVNIYILSIEPINDSLYSLSAQYQYMGELQSGVGIMCIQRVSIIKEKGKWKLQNNLVQYASTWKTIHKQPFYYHFSCNYSVDVNKIDAAASFYNQIVKKYNLKERKRVDYYLASSIKQLGELRGFDYFGVGFTTGITDSRNGYIMSCKGAFHAHELVHLAFYSDTVKRNFLLQEGCAEFLGSRYQYPKTYKSKMKKLCFDILNDSTYTIKNLFNMSSKIQWHGYNYRYYFGAILCQMVYQKQGKSGLRKLMFSNTRKTEGLVHTLIDLLGLKNENQLFKRIKMIATSKIK